MTKNEIESVSAALERLADELRSVRSSVEFSNMDGEVAYYSALNTVATCIEAVVRDLREPSSR